MQQRGLADAARAVEDRQAGGAQVPGDDLLLLVAAEEERGVALAVRDEADERRLRRRRRSVACCGANVSITGLAPRRARVEPIDVLLERRVEEVDVAAATPELLLDLARAVAGRLELHRPRRAAELPRRPRAASGSRACSSRASSSRGTGSGCRLHLRHQRERDLVADVGARQVVDVAVLGQHVAVARVVASGRSPRAASGSPGRSASASPVYLFGISIGTTSPSRRAMHEATLVRAGLRLVPDDVERLAGLPRALARSGRRSSSSGRAAAPGPALAQERRQAREQVVERRSAGSRRRRPQWSFSYSGLLAENRVEVLRDPRQVGIVGVRIAALLGELPRQLTPLGAKLPGSHEPPPVGRRGSRRRRGTGRPRRPRAASRRGRSGDRRRSRDPQEPTFAQTRYMVMVRAPPVGFRTWNCHIVFEVGCETYTCVSVFPAEML